MNNGLKINPNTNLGSATQTMSSLKIAELTEKRHDHVKVDIEKMLISLNLDSPNFREVTRNHQY